MTFLQAKAKLSKVAGTKYHMLDYKMSLSPNKTATTECSIYIHDVGLFSGQTFEEAFAKLNGYVSPTVDWQAMPINAPGLEPNPEEVKAA